MSERRDAVVALITTPLDLARPLARRLVESGLVACVNIVPAVHSVYRWQGGIEEEEEALLIVKTLANTLPALNELLGEEHPYEVHELVAWPIAAGNPAYLDWIAASVSGS